MKKHPMKKTIALAITVCLIMQTTVIGFFVFADWTSLGGERGGHTDGKTPRAAVEASLKWSKTFPQTAQWGSAGYPVIVGDYLYVAVSGSIYKLNKNTAEIAASELLGRPAAGAAAVTTPTSIGYASFMTYGDGKIYVPIEGGDIQAFDANTLAPLWYASYSDNTAYKKVAVRVSGTAGSTVMDATQAAATYPGVTVDDTNWAAVNGKNIKLVSLDYKAETQVLYKAGRIYTGVYYYHSAAETYGTFFSINTADENPASKYEAKNFAWEYEESGGQLRGYYWAGVAAAGDNILVAGDAGKVISLSSANGTLTNSLSIDSGTESLARAGMTYVPDGAGAGALYVSTKAGRLWRLTYNEASGAFGASANSVALSGGPGASAPALSSNKLYTFSGQINGGGRLDVFDKDTLARLSSIDFGGYSQSFPVVSDAYSGKTYLYIMMNEPGNDAVITIEDGAGLTAPKSRVLYKPGGGQSLNSIIADGDGTLYFFDGMGRLNALSSKHLDYDPSDVQGWRKQTDGTWRYFTDGAAQTGWQKISGKWYHFGAANDGVMKTGWQKISGKWYYFGAASDGKMKTGWQKISGKWYYLGAASDGKMKTGWQKISGKWYYFGAASDGKMKTGWQKISGKWYYLGAANDGKMKTGTQKIAGKKYVFKANGVWVK